MTTRPSRSSRPAVQPPPLPLPQPDARPLRTRRPWYHATNAAFQAFEHGHSYRRDWNAYLGVHFARTPAPAHNALKDKNTTGNDSPTGANVIRAHLTGQAAHVTSEGHLTALAVEVGLRAGWFDQPGRVVTFEDMQALKRHVGTLHPDSRSVNYAALERALRAGNTDALHADEGLAALCVLDMQHAVLPGPQYRTAIKELAAHLREHLTAQGINVIVYPNDIEGGISAAVLNLTAIRCPFDPTRPWSNPWAPDRPNQESA